MTDLLSRPILRVAADKTVASRPLLLAAALAAVWTAAVGVIACVAVAVCVWFTGASGSFGQAARVGALAWLVGNGGGLHVPSATITVVPLGYVAVTAWLLYRGGRWAGNHCAAVSLRQAAMAAAVMAASHGLAGMAVLTATWSADVHADPGRSAVACTTLGLVFGGLGLARGAGRARQAFSLVPDGTRGVIAGSAAGALTLLAVGGLLVTASLIVHFSDAITMAEGLGGGFLGGLVLALLNAALVPNAALCAGAFLAGPGFAVGTGTVVAPDGVHLGPVPAVPLLAALPRTTADQWWLAGLIVVPVIAGGIAGLISLRHCPVFGLDSAALRGAAAGLGAGLVFGGLCWLATGAIGPGRMQEIGPRVAETTLVCSLGCLLGGAIGALVQRGLMPVVGPRLRRRRRAG